jgi:hypothetical protein
MITSHYPSGYPDILQLRAGETARFADGVCAVQYDSLTGRVPVYPLYHQGIPYGNYENAVSPGYTGMEDGYIPVADVSFYHAVPGHIDG